MSQTGCKQFSINFLLKVNMDSDISVNGTV